MKLRNFTTVFKRMWARQKGNNSSLDKYPSI